MNPPAPKPPVVRARKRAKRCYELVGIAMLEDENAEWIAVHGTYCGGLGHAWLEHPSGFAFDVVEKAMYPVDEYYRKFYAVPGRRFSRIEFAGLAATIGQWGDYTNAPSVSAPSAGKP